MERTYKKRSGSIAENIVKDRQRKIEELKESTLDIVSAIKQIAYNHAREPLNTEKNLLRWLRTWWCSTYNRPLKDPILKEYTIEELLYEFYIRIERQKVDEERKEEADKIEEDTIKQEDVDWAEQMEKEDMLEQERRMKQKEIEEEIRRRKEEDEEFGDDIDIGF
jgi:hypothetical protein